MRYDDGSDRERAVRVARRADVAVVAAAPDLLSGRVLGPPLHRPRLRSEAAAPGPSHPRGGRANPRTVVVLQSPGPVTMPWARRVGAIVEAWWPGEEGGNAIADVLLGKVNPSGKLPVTYPRALTDVPARTKAQFPGVDGRAVYSEGVLVGYRWYDRRGIKPLFPFGHGLSYTSFHYRDLAVRELRGASPGGGAACG